MAIDERRNVMIDSIFHYYNVERVQFYVSEESTGVLYDPPSFLDLQWFHRFHTILQAMTTSS